MKTASLGGSRGLGASRTCPKKEKGEILTDSLADYKYVHIKEEKKREKEFGLGSRGEF